MKRILVIGCSLLFLSIFFSACGSYSSDTASTPSIPTATVTPPTPATSKTSDGSSSGCTATYGCGVGSSQLTPYTGHGYTINYPNSWAIQPDGSNGAIFAAPDQSASFHVFVQDDKSQTNPLQYEFGTLASDNCKPVASGQKTIQNNGLTWLQTQFICASASADGKSKQISILIATKTYNNTVYSIDYMSNPDTFTTADQTFFQPMVTSFKLQ